MTGQAERIFTRQLAELGDVLAQVSGDKFDAASALVAEARAVHLAGRGRNGLALRAFGNRLMQLGKPVAVLGDILAGPVGAGDVVVIASGSGTTSALVDVAAAARALDARVLLLSQRADSPLGRSADVTLTVPPLPAGTGAQPLGTLFEQCLGLVCDALVVDLMARLDVTVEDMRARHANIE